MKSCKDCKHFDRDIQNNFFGWCLNPVRRIFSKVWALGYTQPSVSEDHKCPLEIK